ncbi:hypothetical protein PM082_004281 [Marasmius tenuissimus]|nr:hypothetical protein PM082_004281 [Marasmius tenuissimus]
MHADSKRRKQSEGFEVEANPYPPLVQAELVEKSASSAKRQGGGSKREETPDKISSNRCHEPIA